ncbi:MAG: hypothetical protein ACE15F_11990, partial [bacterium]
MNPSFGNSPGSPQVIRPPANPRDRNPVRWITPATMRIPRLFIFFSLGVFESRNYLPQWIGYWQAGICNILTADFLSRAWILGLNQDGQDYQDYQDYQD